MCLQTDPCKVMVQHCESTERQKGKSQVDRDRKVIINVICLHLKNYSLISISTCRFFLNKLQVHEDSS